MLSFNDKIFITYQTIEIYDLNQIPDIRRNEYPLLKNLE